MHHVIATFVKHSLVCMRVSYKESANMKREREREGGGGRGRESLTLCTATLL